MFKVPVLRNAAWTAPYFHDGSVADLKQAVTIMANIQAGKSVSSRQLEEIVAFMHSLTGKIPEHALRVPRLPAME